MFYTGIELLHKDRKHHRKQTEQITEKVMGVNLEDMNNLEEKFKKNRTLDKISNLLVGPTPTPHTKRTAQLQEPLYLRVTACMTQY